MQPEAKSAGDQLLHFGPFEINRTRRAVFRNGIRLKLQQQPFSVLELLIERAPDIVLREDIRRRVWGDDVHVDADQGIAFCIRQIRSVLGDNSTSPRYIETIPRQGFRFIGAIEPVPELRPAEASVIPAEPVLPGKVETPVISDRPPRKPRRMNPWVAGPIAAALLVSMGAVASRFIRQNDLYTVSQVNDVTTYPGAALHPSYSPDGRQITFSWDGEGRRSIYIAVPRSEQRRRLTHSASADDFPMWSPDGRYIAFIRLNSDDKSELMLVPALGGEERSLHPVDLSFETVSSSSYLAWTPDSKWICFTTRPDKLKGRERLMLLSPDTGETRLMFSIADRNTSDSSPAFSPDGRWLAFARFSYPFNSTVFVQLLSPGVHPDGDPIAVRGAGTNPISPVWTEDSRSLLFLDRGPSRLFQVDLSDVKSMRPARQIYAAPTQLDGLSLGGPGPRLCTTKYASGTDLWAMPLKADSAGARASRKILDTRATQYHPEYSPDGRALAFVGDRDGSHQVWIASPDGDHPRQLTHVANYILGFPRWSPDGQSISFHARAPVDAELYVVRVADGLLRQVTHGVPGIVVPSWSGDGRFLYGFGAHNETEFVFRITLPLGQRELLWEGTQAREAPGRHLLLYGKVHQRGMFARSLTERGSAEPEQKLVNDFIDAAAGGFVPFNDGFYYSAIDAAGNFRAFCFYSFDSKKTVDVAQAPSNLASGLTVSPDRRMLVYAADKSDEANLISLELKKEGS